MSCGTCGIQASETMQDDTGVPAGAPTTAPARCPRCRAFISGPGAPCTNERCPAHAAVLPSDRPGRRTAPRQAPSRRASARGGQRRRTPGSVTLAATGIPPAQADRLRQSRPTSQELRARVEDHVRTLATLTDEASASERMARYVEAMARFHHYSFGNQILIALQNPDATRVAGYRTWQKLGRQVRRGEHGMMIFVPIPFQRTETVPQPDGSAEEQVRSGLTFGIGYVFDVAQTEGPELPPEPTWVNIGDQGADLIPRLDALAASVGIHITDREFRGRRHGESDGHGHVVVDTRLTMTGRVSTRVHEIAHEIMHPPESRSEGTRQVHEWEAEAVAYVVCQHLGLPAANSPNYLALWRARGPQLLERMEAIAKTASMVIAQLEAPAAPVESPSNPGGTAA